MQKIELTNNQYRMLMQLVALGVELIDNAALGDDEDEDNEPQLLKDAVDLESYLIAHAGKFGIKDIIEQADNNEYADYSEQFMEEHQMITRNAYLNKAAEIASFQLGMRDYKAVNGNEQLEQMPPQEGVDKIMSYSMKYLNEIFENGFGNFHLKTEKPGIITNLSFE